MTAAPSPSTESPNSVHQDLAVSAMALADVFADGGRLVVTAPGRVDHARHVAVEFVHPAITGARALPAMAVTPEDLTTAAGEADAVLIIERSAGTDEIIAPPVRRTLRIGGSLSGAELVRWYHLLWELVQLDLEHRGITGEDSTNFLYPFLDNTESGDQPLVATLTDSARAKLAESEHVSLKAAKRNRGVLDAAAADIAERSRSGGTVFAIGNGGSACDAARLVRRLKADGVQATCLAEDPAVLTALANDLGATMLFSRQIEASVRPADVVVAFSTSGASPNLLAALDGPAGAAALVVACAGYDGGTLGRHQNVDHQLVVESTSVHRIQEAQALLIDQLCERVRA